MLAAVTILERPPAPEEWDAYVNGRPEATLFHRSGWRRVIEDTFGYESRCLAATRGGRLCGILPLYRVATFPLGHALISTPLAVYGGILADDDEAQTALLARAQGLAHSLRVRYLELRNERPVGELPQKTLYVTFRKEIDPNPEINFARIPRNQRRSIRVAQKHGLRADVGGAELIEPFHRIYAESTRNLGTPVFPRHLFDTCFEAFGSDCRILAVYRGDRMVAGVLAFSFRDTVLPYYGGALRDAFQYGCNDFMYWSLMCDAAGRGSRVFDFGRSKRESGSYHFKRHWGFEVTPLCYQYHLVRQSSLPDMSPVNPRFALAIRLWKQVPVPIARWIGPSLVRYFP